tara:strand:+ start:134 stop:643 length:510 start_codon:yes stop_codon:yes gene_type:complete
MAKSNGSDTWNEDQATVLEYIETNEGKLDTMTVLQLQDYLSEGNRTISRQNSITKAIKMQLATITRVTNGEIANPMASMQGKRASFTLSEAEQTDKDENVYCVTPVEGGGVNLFLGERVLDYYDKFNGRTNDDGSKMTRFPSIEAMIHASLGERIDKNFNAEVKEARSA